MAERIVVGVVDTSAGRRALEWAAHRARSRKATLLLASVVGGAVGAVGEGAVVEAAIEAALKLGQRQFDIARADKAGAGSEQRERQQGEDFHEFEHAKSVAHPHEGRRPSLSSLGQRAGPGQ